MPERIQLRRVKGWRMPPGAVKVDRSTAWGNPWIAGRPGLLRLGGVPWQLAGDLSPEQACRAHYGLLRGWWPEHLPIPRTNWPAHKAEHVASLRRYRDTVLTNIATIRGRDLACWCALDQPCHADTLLRIANE